MSNPTTPLDALISAQERIADPKNWCQGTAARDKLGHSVPPDFREAVSWCMVAAISSTTRDKDVIIAARKILRKVINAGDNFAALTGFNDDLHRTHGQVMAVFTKAINLAKQENNGVTNA